MAHLSFEFSAGLERHVEVQVFCQHMKQAMVTAGIFPLAGIRVRGHRAEFYVVADDHVDNNFLAMTISVGAGRSDEALKKAGDLVFKAAQEFLSGPLSAPHFALSLEIRVINPDLSWKDTPIHQRLTTKIAQ